MGKIRLVPFTLGALIGTITLFYLYFLPLYRIIFPFYQKPIPDILSDGVMTEWNQEFEQLCMEDTRNEVFCSCAQNLIVESGDDIASVSGELLYTETKELLQEMCL